MTTDAASGADPSRSDEEEFGGGDDGPVVGMGWVDRRQKGRDRVGSLVD